ncbi:MAG TPA: hypothetical protein VME18_02465 [Acidobacteriaceae bacterium]|nr:hypothetical protein [Acidobacteriaceae bacterium]
MTAKLPAIQFYTGDWRKDIGVQSLSYHDRGIWFEMLCLMHESERRGVLVLNGLAMSLDALARVLGLDKQILTTTISTLLTTGVASREEESGAIYCRRMVRDERLRQIRAEAGKKGGNPVLLKQKKTTADKQESTPSSSSSFSSSNGKKPSRARREDVPDVRHAEFKAATEEYWAAKNANLPMPWNGGEGAALAELLASNPTLKVEQYRDLLRNRYRSEVNHSERPRAWLATVTNYASGPLDRFARPLEAGAHGTNRNSRAKTSGNLDALAAVANEIGVDFGPAHSASGGAPGGDYSGDAPPVRREAF